MTPMARWRQFRALAPGERRAFVFACAALPVAWILLRFGASSSIRNPVQTSPPSRAASDSTTPQALAASIERAARHLPFPSTCLTRSMVLSWMLRSRGIAHELRIGVRNFEGRLDAHAWVEAGGVPVNDRAERIGLYQPLQESAGLRFRKDSL